MSDPKFLRLEPVYAPDGAIQLYDIYIRGEWQGSRRTLKQCCEVAAVWFRAGSKS